MPRILRQSSVYAMSPKNRPVLRVRPPVDLLFETNDCFGGQITPATPSAAQADWNRINPATGPVYVGGAEPGDILSVRVQSIEVTGMGVMTALPGFGVFGKLIKEPETRFVPIVRGQAVFNSRVELPIRPMIGVIGVAPADRDVPCGTPGPHGGNLDTRLIGQGTTVLLPVAVPGALLAMGDVHAVMGDGEIMVTGVEVPAEIAVRVDVRRDLADLKLKNPLLLTDTAAVTLASAKTLDAAVKLATRDMVRILMTRAGMSLNEAGMLCSACGTAAISQVVDPLMTARFEISLKVLRALGVTL